MWIYAQSAGILSRGDKSYAGYSGNGRGKNNPALQATPGIGPIPIGRWRIVGPPYDSPNTGRYTLRLQAEDGTETFGRSEFRIHGDSIAHPGTASHGCIILPRSVRQALWASGDRMVDVVA